MDTNSFIRPFDSPDATLASVGGKGANLSLMMRAGFPVPPGFLITTRAYREFVQANNLQTQIVDVASNQADTSEKRSAAIRELFAKGKVPVEIAEAINHAYADLIETAGDLPLAVRSSATAEDLPGASFAGQQDTYVNVRGKSALLDAVQRCWSSLWTARALDYRTRQNIDPSSVSLAVVVQVMVLAEASGVMFTANPISGARDEIVLDAIWGLGEAIVGGLVTPDHVVADKATGKIKQMTVADKTVMTQPTDAGTEERPVEESKRRDQVLTEPQATELAKLGAQIEKYYSEPQDIEWCLAKGKFYTVQARPITALPPEPVEWTSPIPGAKWIKDIQAGEWVKEPPSPLGMTTTLPTMVKARESMRTWPPFIKHHPPWCTLINGWFYQRADHKMAATIEFMLLLPVSIFLWSFGIGSFDGNKRFRRRWPPRIARLDALERMKLGALSDEALRARVDQLLRELRWWWMEFTWFNGLGRPMVFGLLNIWPAELADPGALVVGNDNLMLESERALRRAASDPTKVQDYLARFGHMVESADPMDPTLRESPEHLEWQLAAARNGADPDTLLAAARERREKAERLVRSVKGYRGYKARKALAITQSHVAHTDDAVFHFQRALAALRATFLEAGRRLALAGKLAYAKDVFYLEKDELWKAEATPSEELAAKVAERRAVREQQVRLTPPLLVPPFSDPAWAKDPMVKMMSPAMNAAIFERGLQQRDGKRVLVGNSGSPGRVRGTARVIMGPEDFDRFQKGDILIARTTSPIWTPLFGMASAAVTETGGMLSHAAIVAREFGIPLVNGAPGATRVIPDGTPIVVDGSAGIVEI